MARSLSEFSGSLALRVAGEMEEGESQRRAYAMVAFHARGREPTVASAAERFLDGPLDEAASWTGSSHWLGLRERLRTVPDWAAVRPAIPAVRHVADAEQRAWLLVFLGVAAEHGGSDEWDRSLRPALLAALGELGGAEQRLSVLMDCLAMAAEARSPLVSDLCGIVEAEVRALPDGRARESYRNRVLLFTDAGTALRSLVPDQAAPRARAGALIFALLSLPTDDHRNIETASDMALDTALALKPEEASVAASLALLAAAGRPERALEVARQIDGRRGGSRSYERTLFAVAASHPEVALSRAGTISDIEERVNIVLRALEAQAPGVQSVEAR